MTEEEIINTIRKQKGSCEGILCNSYDEETNTAFLCPLYNMCDFTTCEQRLGYLNEHYPEQCKTSKFEFTPGEVYSDGASFLVLCTKSDDITHTMFVGYPIGKNQWKHWINNDDIPNNYLLTWCKEAFHHVTMEVKDDAI